MDFRDRRLQMAATTNSWICSFRASKLLVCCLAKGALTLVAVFWVASVLDHPDVDQACVRIDGHIGGISAAVAEAPETCGPAESVSLLNRGAGLLAGHLLHSGL